MNDSSSKRYRVGAQIAKIYAADPAAVGVGCVGSTSRGEADSFSDLDLCVFWSGTVAALPEDPLLTSMGGARFVWSGITDSGAALEQYFVGDLKVDVAHRPTVLQERYFSQLLEGRDVSPERIKELAVLGDLDALHGDAEIARIRDRAREFPTEIRARVVESLLPFVPLFYLELCLRRGDRLGFTAMLIESAGKAIGILAALNGAYLHPACGLKDALRRLRSFPRCVPGFPKTLEDLLNAPTQEAITALLRHLEDTLSLVEDELPGVATADARRILGFSIQKAF